jgi:hypothetical protein
LDWSRTLSWACHCAGFGVETIRSKGFGELGVLRKKRYGSTADLDDKGIVLLVRWLDNVKRRVGRGDKCLGVCRRLRTLR